MDNFKRIDAASLYPPFLKKLEALVVACEARGAIYIATCGERSWEAQDALYAYGRTVVNAEHKAGHYVTKAKGGESLHQFWFAVDFTRDSDPNKTGLQPDYRDSSNLILAEEAVKLGLEAGYYWKFKDTPHVQLPFGRKGITLAMLQLAYKKGGKDAVFALLDKFTW